MIAQGKFDVTINGVSMGQTNGEICLNIETIRKPVNLYNPDPGDFEYVKWVQTGWADASITLLSTLQLEEACQGQDKVLLDIQVNGSSVFNQKAFYAGRDAIGDDFGLLFCARWYDKKYCHWPR